MRISFHSRRQLYKAERRLVRNADRLFAGFGLLGAVLLTGAGQEHANWLLAASGVVSFMAEIWLLVKGADARRLCGLLFVLSSLLLLGSGTGVLGLSAGSAGEAFCGTLTTLGAVCVFYGVPPALKRRITGPQLGSVFYNVSCLPLFWAGIARHNPSEVAAAIAYVLGDVAIALKQKD